MSFLKQNKCRACGKVSHVVDKAGRLQTPVRCPYCGTENPYPNRTATVVVIAIIAVAAIFQFWMR